MTQSATAPITAAMMLAETQSYRTSLESLMELGRGMLLQPSMEDSSSTAFKVLAEGVLETADHQADLIAVDGVTEPAAVVELIMQDVLTPRLTDLEAIERSLQAKADSEEPVPFTTRDAETTASMEAIHHKAEVLDIFLEHVGDIKTIIASTESLTADVLRPMVMRLVARAGIDAVSLGVSLEALADTQVLGEMSDAVDRIETLVAKAHEAATSISDAARSEAEGVGAGGEDKLGDVIEAHRGDQAVGPQLDEGTSATTVENTTQTPTTDAAAAATEGSDVTADSATAADDSSEATLELEPVDTDTTGTDDASAAADDTTSDDDAAAAEDNVDTADNDDTASDDAATSDDTDADLDAIGDEANIPTDVDAVELDDAAATTDDTTDSNEEEEKPDDEEEEEDDKSTASTESLDEAIVIDSMAKYTDDQGVRGDIITTVLDVCGGLELLSDKGKAALASGVNETFELSSDMFLPATADIMTRHYETWATAAIRDDGANVRALLALVNN